MAAWFDGEDYDPESGVSHLAHVAAGMMILMDADAAGKLRDDRPKTRKAAAMLKRLQD